MMGLYLENKELNEREFKEKKIILQSKPLTLRLILNNYCNIDCIMCDLAVQKNRFTIPYRVIEQIIHFFPFLERIDWQGGEVFLVDYFEKALEEASHYPNLYQTLQTNGLLLNRKWAELLAKYNVAVLFSIDGTMKETYEYIRRGARFKDLLENISVFNEYKKKYNSNASKILCVCVMRHNYIEVEKFVDFAIEYGFNQVTFGAIHGSDILNQNIFNPVDPQAIKHLSEKMPQIEEICKERGIILECSFKSYLINTGKDLVKNNCTSNNNSQLKCKLPWTNLCVDAIRGGRVYPECLCFTSAGDIMKESLLDIWNSPVMQQYRLTLTNGDFKNICSEYCNLIKQ